MSSVDTELEVPEGMTALYDAEVPRADLVEAAANGVPRPLIAKQAEGAPGLLDADFVRSLIAKADPEPTPQETVTMTGSPAAIAEMIHKAAMRQAQAVSPATVGEALNGGVASERAGTPVEKVDYESFTKAKYNADELKHLAATGAAMEDGCLAAETLIATRNGARCIADLVGGCELLTDAGWTQAEVRSFGTKDLFAVTLKSGTESTTVHATAGHRWLLVSGNWCLTRDLATGDQVPHVEVLGEGLCASRLNPTQRCVAGSTQETSDDSRQVVVVDMECRPPSASPSIRPLQLGNASTDCTTPALLERERFEVSVGDAVLAKQGAFATAHPPFVSNLNAFGTASRALAHAEATIGSPSFPADVEVGMRALDTTSPADYRAFELDGHAGGGLAWVRDSVLSESVLEVVLPTEPLGAVGLSTIGFGTESHGSHSTQSRTWTVVDVEETGRFEEVFCAVVPDLHRFVLANGVLTGNSYPIADREDLDRAIRAVGRGGADHDAIRQHIAARAKALGASGEIPDNWASDGSLKKGTGPMETDDIELTEVLAEPEIDAPGNPTTPGSPAWEAIDAATACKWTAVLARARAAIDVMAEREMLEAAAGDEDDAESAWDLQDACCAIDYAIDILAPFAIGEHAEAEMGADMLAAVGKAVAAATAPLEVIEGLAPVRKAGRVLSSANEAAIRGAVESLQKVLASLPAAPAVEDAVTKTANEEPNMPTPTPSEDATAASGQEPAMGSAQTEPKPVAGQAVTDMAKAEETPVAKAGAKPDQMAVYDSDGNLVGVVDPSDVTRLMSAKAPVPADTGTDIGTDDGSADGNDGQMAAAQPTDDGTTPTDLAPAPADAVGTPADATTADDDGNVVKAETPEPTNIVPTDMLKSSDVQAMVKAALDDYSAGQADVIKGLEDQNRALEERNTALTKEAAGLKAELAKQADRLSIVENQPAVMAIASNGAIPPQHLLRGQDRGAPANLTKGQEMRAAFRSSDDAARQQDLAKDMNALAIEELAKIHAAGPR